MGWYERFRSAISRRLAAQAAKDRQITVRLNGLIERLRGRLSAQDYDWARENSDQTEWELAIETIHEAMRRGALTLDSTEVEELASIETEVDQRPFR